MRATSLICAAVAVVVCAWFALGARQAINTQRADAIVGGGGRATAAQVRQVHSLVRAAQLLNPDREPDVLLGAVEAEHGDFTQARSVLEPVTRSEPQNLAAWQWLAATAGRDLPLLFKAARHLRQLEPRFPSS